MAERRMADVKRKHKINTSQETEKQRSEPEEKARLEQQNLEKESVRKEILEVCKILSVGDSHDVADVPDIPGLCQLLKKLAENSELKLGCEITDIPEDFSCLLKLIKAHRYGFCNITICCEILNNLQEVSGSPYSTQTQAELLKELSELWITKASYDKAINTAKELAKLATELGDKKLEGEAYYILFKLHVLKGSLEQAKLTLEKCVQCSEESGDELTIGYSKFAKATIYYLEQQYDKALEEDETFLEIAKRLNNKLAECEAIFQMATIHCTLFDIQKSLNLFSKGLQIAKELGHRKKVLETQANQTSMFSLMGNYRKAYRIGQKMVESLNMYEDKAFKFTILCNLSVDALLLNEDNESLRLANESLEVAKELDAGEPIALAYGNIGLAQEKLKDYPGAIESYKQCLEYGKKIKDNRIISNGYCNLGRAYEGKGDKERARKFYLEALQMPEPPSSHWCDTEDFRFSPDYLLGKMAVEESDFSTARKYFQQVVDRCEQFRKSVQDSPLKISFNDTQMKPFQYLQHVLLKDKADAAALLVGEMGRGRDFYDKVIEEDRSKQLNTPEALISLAKRNNQAVLFLSKLDVVQEMRIWFIAPDGKMTSLGQPLGKWEKIFEDLRFYFSQVLIGDVSPSSHNTVIITDDDQAVPLSAEGATEFRGVVDKFLSDEESEDDSDDEAGVTKGAYVTQQEDSAHPSSDSAPARTRGGDKAPELPEFSDLIDQLSELILRPIEENLVSLASQNAPKPQLLIIPQADTFNIPYSTLRLKNGKPLCSLVSPREAFSFHSYSYSTTLQEEAKSKPVQMEDVLIVGNPTNNLPFAQKEAEAIAEKLGVKPLIKESATRNDVLRLLTKAPIIHFACHGTVDGKGLLLAPERGNDNEKPTQSYLTVKDVSNMSLQAKLVVLSACHSARGKISSEGVLGLARAFLMAGAKSVVTALWAINDNATERFMLKFYGKLYSEPVVDALSNTMCEMKREKFKVTQWGSFKVLGANIEVFPSAADV